MAKVYLYEGEDLSNAIKRFNKKVLKDDIMNECRKREYYRKPNEIRKEKAKRARKMQALQAAKAARREQNERR